MSQSNLSLFDRFQKGLVAAKLVGKVLPDGNPYEKADTYFSVR